MGFSPSDAAAWRPELDDYMGHGVYDCSDLGKVQTISIADLADWRNARFNIADALELTHFGLTSEEAARWRAAGFSVTQTINKSDSGLETEMAVRSQRKLERDYPAGPMDDRDADALLECVVKHRGLSVAITINNGRGDFKVRGPVSTERVALMGVGSVYVADGAQFTAAQVVSIEVKGQVRPALR